MMDNNASMPRWLMPLLLLMSLTACSAPPANWPAAPVANAQLPPLPPAARQPSLPPFCSPTCSAALTVERVNWQHWLTEPSPQASPASAPMMPSGTNHE